MKCYWLCRKFLSPHETPSINQLRSILCTSIKSSDMPKPTINLAKLFNTIMKTAEEIGKLPIQNEIQNIVTLDNVFGDSNKKRVQEKMADVKTTPRPDSAETWDLKAAVLVPLCHVKGEPSLLFIARSVFLKNHKGEISFPGGMKDTGDRDPTHTALRETYEEIGLPMNQVEVWGLMHPVPSKMTGRWVTPVLGYCGEINIDKLQLNPKEVEDVFTVPVSVICDPVNQRQTQWRYPGIINYTLPVFLGDLELKVREDYPAAYKKRRQHFRKTTDFINCQAAVNYSIMEKWLLLETVISLMMVTYIRAAVFRYLPYIFLVLAFVFLACILIYYMIKFVGLLTVILDTSVMEWCQKANKYQNAHFPIYNVLKIAIHACSWYNLYHQARHYVQWYHYIVFVFHIYSAAQANLLRCTSFVVCAELVSRFIVRRQRMR